ncbi:cadherin-23 [Caerostris extrusa]|uniref:Cadherin-23 n=1 Tax=Caerostris extrusa TaxID=172846 RepID=A0AAV4Q1I9_CAEEX|nr:cadherin-23 [Caerostris extrusa]
MGGAKLPPDEARRRRLESARRSRQKSEVKQKIREAERKRRLEKRMEKSSLVSYTFMSPGKKQVFVRPFHQKTTIRGWSVGPIYGILPHKLTGKVMRMDIQCCIPSTDENVDMDVFHVNPETGVISNNEPLGKYVGGHFDITVEARSSPDARFVAYANVKIYILQDRDLLKFVFYKRPNEVREIIPDFEKALKEAVAQPISLNIYDTNFYARNDGSLDFESTSSCFQLLENDVIIEPKESHEDFEQRQNLPSFVNCIQIINCASSREAYRMLWSEIVVCVIAAVMAFVSFILCILICTMYSNYTKKLKRMSYFHSVYLTENGGHPPLSPAEQKRIYEWQEMNAPLADAASFKSYPTLR